MNVHERFKKIDALDKDRKITPRSDGEILEMVNHPNHYGGKEDLYEAINVIEAWGLDFHCGSVIKYIARHKKKGSPKEDIEKAIWYLERYRDECLGE